MPACIAALSFHKSGFGFETTGLILMLAANLVDLLPNASISPLTWLVAGAVWGRIELGRVTDATEPDPVMSKVRSSPVYTRFGRPVRPDGGQVSNPYARRHTS